MFGIEKGIATGVNARKLWVTVIDDLEVMDDFRREVYQRLENLVRENRMPETRAVRFFTTAPELWRNGQDPISGRRPTAFWFPMPWTRPAGSRIR